ncbi:MAG: phosphodiester glycosidase family protein [Cyanobacteria bacterium RU_5_0]|nr:phosphodiester glycosidase family protein [Cyanobacteria bacterium RU_5_0]
MNHRHWSYKHLLTTLISCLLLAFPLLLYAIPHLQRPSRLAEDRSLFQGITYRREARSTPRPILIHVVTIDLTAPGIGILVTPGRLTEDNTELTARTTSEFLNEFDLQLAINANFFYEFIEKTPWEFYPHSGDRVNAVGQAISNGEQYSMPEAKWAVICFTADNRAQIVSSGECPDGTRQAVAGSAMLVTQGRTATIPPDSADSDAAYSRTVVAIDQSGETLWIVAIDDKQLFYSKGVTLPELTAIVLELGADAAINLDGGGSTTLVTETPSGTQILNAPIHTRIPMRERPVANHLGFYAQPLKE